nr:protein SENSITIVE TO PROTON RHIZOTOXICITY 1-like [Ipomoea trifida]
MHMRAHGNLFKTLEALAKLGKCCGKSGPGRNTLFLCPFVGCSRKKTHKNHLMQIAEIPPSEIRNLLQKSLPAEPLP